jgi:FdhD protein
MRHTSSKPLNRSAGTAVLKASAERAADGPLPEGAAPDIEFSLYSSESWSRATTCVPREMEFAIFVGGRELVTILCTPTRLTHLVLGFLFSEGVIDGMKDVASMRVCEDDSLADVMLARPGYEPPERRTVGSGCGGGVSLATERQRVDSSLVVTPGQVSSLMKQMNRHADLYRACGGVHTSALADAEGLKVIAEDIGRHNTLDKIAGQCLMTGLSTRDGLLLTTGRLSSEMLYKATRMGTPVVVSRSSPTDRSISLGQELGITLIGYARGDRMSVYSHQERVQGARAQ